MLKIRVHHLLCMQGFQGFGYDENFVKNMKEILNHIKNNPKELIEVVAKCDSICFACPNKNAKNICVKKENERIKKEKKLAEFLNIKLDAEHEIEALFSSTNKKISSKKIAEKIYCSECLWRKCCLWYSSKK